MSHPSEIPDIVRETLDHVATLICFPDPIRTRTETTIQTEITDDTGTLSTPPTRQEIIAIALLEKRHSESDIHRDAAHIADQTPDITMKEVLARVYSIDTSPVLVPKRKRDGVEFVEALKIAASTLTDDFTGNTPIDSWCEQTGITDSDTLHNTVTRQAALTVLLRSLLFEATGSIDVGTLSQKTYPEAVATTHRDYGDISPDWFALDTVAEMFDPAVFTWLIELRNHITPIDTPSVYLAEAYEQLVEQEDRWRLGEFGTPHEVATLTAALGQINPDDSVLAPGIGAGTIALETARLKRDAGCSDPLSDIHAVDVSPLRLLLGSTALLAADATGQPTVSHTDFFDVDPNAHPDISTVVTNPPYTKHHELSTHEKQRLNEQAERTTGYSISKLSPLYVYFSIHATQFLNDGGNGVFLTPAEILNTEYGTEWKEYMLEAYDVDAFILFDQANGSKFNDVDTTSLITVGTRRTTPGGDGTTSFVRVDDQPDDETLIDVVNQARATETTGQTDTDWGFVNTVATSSLIPSENWSVYFDGYEPVIDDQLIPFDELVQVTRGIATGQNSFFCLSEDDRSGSGNNESWDISEEFLAPIIRKSHQVPHYDYREDDWTAQREAGTEVWLLYHTTGLDWNSTYFEQEIAETGTSQQQLDAFTPGDERETGANTTLSDTELDVVSYLKYGMQLDNPPHQTHLGRNRDQWYVVEQRPPANILYTSMTRDQGRFIYNRMDARNLNNVHSIYITADLTEMETKALLAYLNSSFADTIIKRSGRTLSSGMSKVEPGDLSTIPVIDPRELPEHRVTDLAMLFDDLCQASRTGTPSEEAVRVEIRDALNRFLDM